MDFFVPLCGIEPQSTPYERAVLAIGQIAVCHYQLMVMKVL